MFTNALDPNCYYLIGISVVTYLNTLLERGTFRGLLVADILGGPSPKLQAILGDAS